MHIDTSLHSYTLNFAHLCWFCRLSGTSSSGKCAPERAQDDASRSAMAPAVCGIVKTLITPGQKPPLTAPRPADFYPYWLVSYVNAGMGPAENRHYLSHSPPHRRDLTVLLLFVKHYHRWSCHPTIHPPPCNTNISTGASCSLTATNGPFLNGQWLLNSRQ